MGRNHKLRYLPLALTDLLDIAGYIYDHLHAPQAATELMDRLDKSISQLAQFPYAGPAYGNSKLQDNYRMLIVENFLVFYVIYEDDGIVEIRRVLYGKRNYERFLNP